jgi:hypothetical protein
MSTMMMLLILAGILAAVLTVLLIYRSTLEMHEDDQLFLSDGETQMAKDQADLQGKLSKIEPMVKVLGAACVLVLLTVAGMWIYQGLNQTNIH